MPPKLRTGSAPAVAVSPPLPSFSFLSPLASLKDAAEEVQYHVLRSSFVFPRTESLKGDKPSWSVSFPAVSPETYVELMHQAKSHPEMISLCAEEDVIGALEILGLVHEKLYLFQFDTIQIYRGGVDLLRIVNESRNCGRSVYLELNEFRRRLAELAVPSLQRRSNLFWMFVFAVLNLLIFTLIPFLMKYVSTKFE